MNWKTSKGYLSSSVATDERPSGSSVRPEFQRSRVEILSGLMRLRQICDTPALFMEDYQGASGKLDSLRRLAGTGGRWWTPCLDFLAVQGNVGEN